MKTLWLYDRSKTNLYGLDMKSNAAALSLSSPCHSSHCCVTEVSFPLLSWSNSVCRATPSLPVTAQGSWQKYGFGGKFRTLLFGFSTLLNQLQLIMKTCYKHYCLSGSSHLNDFSGKKYSYWNTVILGQDMPMKMSLCTDVLYLNRCHPLQKLQQAKRHLAPKCGNQGICLLLCTSEMRS